MSELLVSIDLGTTRLKVAAYRLEGTLAHLVVRRHEDHTQASPDGDRRWQSAERWWEDVVAGVRELLTLSVDARVLGVSLSGRGGAAVFTDAQGAVIANPWADNRHKTETRQLVEWRRSGAHLSNYGVQLIAKYFWLKQTHPDAAAAIVHGFYAKDWLLYKLTGAHLTDQTSGPDAAAWDSRLAELELPDTLLPAPSLPWTSAGSLTVEAAEMIGLPAGTPVAVGAHDGLAANIGAGAIDDGEFAITLGTHAVVRAVQNEHPPGAYRFYGFPPASHIIGGNAVLAGRSADWYLELIGAADADRSLAYAEAEALAGRVPPGADGVRFLPFLAGQVSPEARPGARGLFAGLGLAHGQGELYRAVLEGASFAVRGIFDQVVGWCGLPARIRVTGGGADSTLWVSILANVLNQPIELTGEGVEGRGAVMCLAVALGLHSDLHQARDAMVRLEETVQPVGEQVAAYQAAYEDWSRLNDLSRSFDQHPSI
jgi:xylulokinase